jgi:predicted enzyme related to lactoylglutathione lyase
MPPSTANPVVHLELHTRDLPRACAFYAALCGWWPERIEHPCGGYTALALGSRLGGGIVECPTERPVWLPYVEVAEISEAMRQAHLLGARVLLGPREGPAGWRGVVEAPEGAQLALWQPKR